MANIISAQYDIDIKIKDYQNDTLLIGYYLGEKTLARDTLIGKKGSFNYKGEESLKPGVYMLLTRPDNNFVQVLVNDKDQEFSIKWDPQSAAAPQFKGSEDNEIFNDYIDYLSSKRNELEDVNKKIDSYRETGKDTTELLAKIDLLDKEVKDYQHKVVEKNPSYISSLFLKSNFDINVPEYEGSKEEVRTQQYHFYRKHFFDHVDLSNPAMIRTPFFHEKVTTYMDRLTPQMPDSIIVTIDYLLDKMSPAEDTYRYYLSHFVNTYATKAIVGMDAVYVHLVDNYYSKGKAPWAEESTLKRLETDANNIRGSLIGKIFPDITTFTSDTTPVRIHDINSEFTVVIFWKHTCGHCKKSMPAVKEFADAYKNKGVTVVTVCTEAGKNTPKCIDYAEEKGFHEGIIATYDEHQRYRRKLYINTTPKVFILDANKEIVLKDIDAKKLGMVIDAIKEERKTEDK